MENIAQLFAQHLPNGQRALYRHHRDGAWYDVTVADLASLAALWQAAFAAHSFVAGDRVAICLKNGIQWVAVDLAALGAGLVVVPLYVDDNPENIAYCVQNSGVRLVVVENDRMRNALERAGVTAAGIVVVRPEADDDPRGVERFLPSTGSEYRVAAVDPKSLATICYTSGTGGRPKGVMLSHRNVLANVESILKLGIGRADDEFLSFLPLSHMFERTGGYYMPLSLGAKVTYARSVAHLADDLAEQKPTAIFAVPRVFEKFAQKIYAATKEPGLKRTLFLQCVDRGSRVARGAR
ncbi:MAG: AMP-binding protein, partial [Burkholderiales bacterium]